MNGMHRSLFGCALMVSLGCTASHAYIDYSKFSAFAGEPGSNGLASAQGLGPLHAEVSSFVWSSCDDMVSELLEELRNKSTMRGGNAIAEIRFEDHEGNYVMDPTCVQEWGWVFLYPAFLLPVTKTVVARAQAVQVATSVAPVNAGALSREAQIDSVLMEQNIRLQNPGIKCASLPISPLGISGNVARLIDEVLLGELQGAGFEALGSDDINAMLGLEELKDAVACDAASCMTEIGGALGVDYLVSGKVGALDSAKLLALKLIDVRQARVLARANGQCDSEADLPELANRLVDDLVRQSGL